jgi:hypothetical protein
MNGDVDFNFPLGGGEYHRKTDGVVNLWELQEKRMEWLTCGNCSCCGENALTLPPTSLIFSGCIFFFCFTADSIREFDQRSDIGGGKMIN